MDEEEKKPAGAPGFGSKGVSVKVKGSKKCFCETQRLAFVIYETRDKLIDHTKEFVGNAGNLMRSMLQVILEHIFSALRLRSRVIKREFFFNYLS